MCNNYVRGSGRTTRQVIDAPRKAIYISPNNPAMRYNQEIDKAHGRSDIIHMSLLFWINKFSGLSQPCVIDHSCQEVLLDHDQREALAMVHIVNDHVSARGYKSA